MTTPNALSELQELALTRPAVGADPAIEADWYVRKAIVLTHLHDDVHADQARRHADALLRTCRSTGCADTAGAVIERQRPSGGVVSGSVSSRQAVAA